MENMHNDVRVLRVKRGEGVGANLSAKNFILDSCF